MEVCDIVQEAVIKTQAWALWEKGVVSQEEPSVLLTRMEKGGGAGTNKGCASTTFYPDDHGQKPGQKQTWRYGEEGVGRGATSGQPVTQGLRDPMWV